MNRALGLALGMMLGGALILLLFRPAATAPGEPRTALAVPAGTRCTVDHVFDGDSLRCREQAQQVRLLLIDSPEKDQGAAAEAARRFARRLMPAGTPLSLETDAEPRDGGGRVLAYAWLPDGRMANEEMVRAGHALLFPFRMKNVRYLKRIADAEDRARRESAGFWADGPVLCTPEKFRHKDCTGFQ